MISTPTFVQKLKWGKVGETSIALWLRKRGWHILPVYDIPLDTGKGPTFFTALKTGHDALIAPDMLAMNGLKIQWVEAKRKSVFSWRQFGKDANNWQTGIDIRHYEDYLRIREISQLPLWIMFLHVDSRPSEKDKARGCDACCPVGLFGREILHLNKHIAHRDVYSKYGRDYPMVYWNCTDLIQLATLEEVLS